MSKTASPVMPYRIGDKIKIQYSSEPKNFYCSFGVVVDNKNIFMPKVAYVDFSELKIQKFNRIVRRNEIEMIGKFTEHHILPI